MTNLFRVFVVSAALAATVVAQTKPSAKPASKASAAPSGVGVASDLPTEETMNSFLYQMFGYDPTITWKVQEIRPSQVPGLAEVTVILSNAQGSNANKLYISADGKHALTGDILPFGSHPFDGTRATLEKGVAGPTKGPARAAVTIVEFSDMQCPHCKQAAPTVDQLLSLEPDVHFVFQNFPLPAHNWAEKAAAYVDCVGLASNDAVWKFINKTFDEQTNITESNADEKLKGIAADSGVKADEVAACAAKPDTKARVEASVALGKSVGVNGTPALFINGRPMGAGAPVDVLKKVVEFEASQSKEGKPGAN